MTETIDALFELSDAANAQLAASLKAQTQRLVKKKYTLLSTVIALFAFSILLGVLIVRNVTRSARVVSGGLKKLANGDLDLIFRKRRDGTNWLRCSVICAVP